MHQSHQLSSRSNLLAKYFAILTVSWSFVVSGLLVVDLFQIYHTQQDMATNEARANFNKDQAFRLWAASHGGIYVPITKHTPVNPYLSHVQDRDITTPAGKSLTLMNPAYMLRQVMDEFSELYGIRGHITSLKPLRRETAPDEWEKLVLVKFERGVDEVSEFTEINGEPYIRLMRPLYVQEDCLKCHAHQGYKEGDVRGGISMAVPMTPYLASAKVEMEVHTLSFGVLLVLGLTGIGFARRALMRRMQEQDHAELALQRARDALEERTAELTEANEVLRLNNEALEHFAFIASHDLQEPLRKIQTFGNLLSSSCAEHLNGGARDYLQRMQNAAMRMQTLIQAVLRYSRSREKLESYGAVDLTGLALEVVADLEIRIRETEGTVQIGDLPIIEADASRMRQLFQNLMGNALKYHQKGKAPLVKINAVPCQEGFYEIHVEDNGIGFDEKHLDTIFKPFERLHGRTQYEGTGLGLAICKRIAEQHGGSITARSKPGEGSTFIVTLPAKQA